MLKGLIVKVEPTIEIHEGFSVNVNPTTAPSGSFAFGIKYVEVSPPWIVYAIGFELNTGGRFMINTLKENGTVFTPSNN